MASPTIKSTYSLDLDTVRALERTATRWKVSKSEALRRAIRMADTDTAGTPDAVRALERLQKTLKLTPGRARDWAHRAREGRRDWAKRSEARGE